MSMGGNVAGTEVNSNVGPPGVSDIVNVMLLGLVLTKYVLPLIMPPITSPENITESFNSKL